MAQSRNLRSKSPLIAIHRFELTAAIVCGQLCAFAFRKIDIRVIKERREIVFGKTGSHSLEIDEVRRPFR